VISIARGRQTPEQKRRGNIIFWAIVIGILIFVFVPLGPVFDLLGGRGDHPCGAPH
jgi:hypothetical protein